MMLVDGMMVINEVIDLDKKFKKPCLIFKVDFEKAYDSLNYSFLDYMCTSQKVHVCYSCKGRGTKRP